MLCQPQILFWPGLYDTHPNQEPRCAEAPRAVRSVWNPGKKVGPDSGETPKYRVFVSSV